MNYNIEFELSENFKELTSEKGQFHFDLINLLINLNVSMTAFDNSIFINFTKKYCKNNLGLTLNKSQAMEKSAKSL